MGEHACMSPEDIERCDETIYPVTLSALVRDLHAQVEITEPRQLPWR